MAGPLRRLNPFRKDRRRWGRRHNPDGTMSLVDHLFELRYRLGVAMTAVVVGAVFGIWWFAHPVFGLPPLSEILMGPYCALPVEQRLSPNGRCQLLQTEPFEIFMLTLKVGMAVGALVFSPVWLYQLWAFITPGLYDKERKFARTFVFFASILFAAGAVLAYFVLPEALTFMAGFGGDAFFTALTGGKYINFMLLLLVIFGVSFELPLILVMLNLAGIVSYAKIKSWWRGLVFALFVFAAVATPGQDPFSMLALAAALCLLFLVAALICRANDKRREKKLAAQGLIGVGLDEASPIDYRPSDIDTTPSKLSQTDDVT
ncbi:sec-independent protein translocase protein TatC [Saccharopolyspora subtropica]|uniref:Sec-independent protein translocase protein TatC n=1 Tax=Saccharopolyspora thermophila TaxID=89367 RepID=A0A917NFJ7_9PSEU|nr:twin-arginine translocase subunit TatC [Saccharopolyspora subtropica]GGI96046.1 sec-independent protein translocase protein TatC [Saccharopolyspora subtropica]